MPEEKSLISPGHFGSDSSNIIIIKDFISSSDLTKIQNFYSTITEWDNPRGDEFNEDGTCIYDASYWWDRMCSGEIIKRLSIDAYETIDFYIKKMASLIEDKYDVEVFCRPPVLIRWLPGNLQSPHADKQLNDGSPNPFPLYDLNSVIYWNDEFTGGQIYYPQHGIEVEIEPGMAVAHPGDIHYMHGVKEVISGVRWTTPSFYTITKLGRK